MTIFKKTIFVIHLSVFASCAFAQPIIMVLGDSLSAAYRMAPEQGWVKLLAKRLEKESSSTEVINKSTSGATSYDALKKYILWQKKNEQLDILIIGIGGNDGLRGFPLDKTKQNIASIIEKTKHHNPKIEILLLEMRLPPNYGAAYTKAFTKVYHDLVKTHDVELVPFILNDVALNKELMLEDGIHPNVKAQTIILNNIWAPVKASLMKLKTTQDE